MSGYSMVDLQDLRGEANRNLLGRFSREGNAYGTVNPIQRRAFQSNGLQARAESLPLGVASDEPEVARGFRYQFGNDGLIDGVIVRQDYGVGAIVPPRAGQEL